LRLNASTTVARTQREVVVPTTITLSQPSSVSRHSPDSRSLRGEDRPFGRLEQRQIAGRVPGRRSKPPVDRADVLKCVALPASGRTSGVVCCICPNRLMRLLAAHASRRSATAFRRTSMAAPRPRPSGRLHAAVAGTSKGSEADEYRVRRRSDRSRRIPVDTARARTS